MVARATTLRVARAILNRVRATVREGSTKEVQVSTRAARVTTRACKACRAACQVEAWLHLQGTQVSLNIYRNCSVDLESQN